MRSSMLETSTSDPNELCGVFVQALISELSKGKIELPGFPTIVARVQSVLSDAEADMSRIVRVLGGEPTLAAQLMRMGSSVAFNRSGTAVKDLRTAVTRIGLDTVRSAAIALAVRQLREAQALKGLETYLDGLWQRSAQMASLSFVIARRHARVGADTALLAGLLQGVGRLYILVRVSQFPHLLQDREVYRKVEADYHLNVAAAVLRNWSMAEEIIEAVQHSESDLRQSRRPVGLADILCASAQILDASDPQGSPSLAAGAKPVSRLSIREETRRTLLEESAQELQVLQEALG